MINKCKWCGNEKLKFVETPNLVHFGKMICQHCNKFCYWVRNPNLPINNRKNKKTTKQVCEFHRITGEMCFLCLRERKELGQSETLTVDHIQELDKGGEDIIENMQVLCSACHKLKNWVRLYMHWHLKKDGNSKTIKEE